MSGSSQGFGLGLGGYGSDDDDDVNTYDNSEEGINIVSQFEANQADNQLPNRVQEPIDDSLMKEDNIRIDLSIDATSQEDPSSIAFPNGDVISGPKDPLHLLPPELRDPLPTSCPPELQDRFRGFLEKTQRTGKTFNFALKSQKAYRNPNFMQNSVQYFGIEQYGSAFSPEVFDPTNLPLEDTKEALLKALDEEQLKRATIRAQMLAAGNVAAAAAQMEFARGTGSLGTLAPPMVGSVATSAAAATAAAAAVAARVSKFRPR
mmetsp:Transcript_20431/g.36663  ORF Transcript_20431/g.36663 Transcript_20431/m.36663 type:complete len:262 (-) Transcript_20431:124-909(-)|eukprot:CAMPEP_0175049712 /NCGR_PEP_ID=MMETSP0052_2-20121109/6874_1 /TAXON_ID=51329 ORGANISM="Polytomella parva, Strain SAG 63-3" /NCGR_SAMPLE_ID=MMETSP0052_2 /ASSEMBLY_ACC=CAM_ASM_000194 /LENGTH=261 /DNA_ID=CAMNT_0016313871 /DNA_START=1359 /DNA_END=2144 /DNA_ORIENTATION=-